MLPHVLFWWAVCFCYSWVAFEVIGFKLSAKEPLLDIVAFRVGALVHYGQIDFFFGVVLIGTILSAMHGELKEGKLPMRKCFGIGFKLWLGSLLTWAMTLGIFAISYILLIFPFMIVVNLIYPHLPENLFFVLLIFPAIAITGVFCAQLNQAMVIEGKFGPEAIKASIKLSRNRKVEIVKIGYHLVFIKVLIFIACTSLFVGFPEWFTWEYQAMADCVYHVFSLTTTVGMYLYYRDIMGLGDIGEVGVDEIAVES